MKKDIFSVLVLNDNYDFQLSVNNLRNDTDIQIIHVDPDLQTVITQSVVILDNGSFDNWVVISSRCVTI